MSVAASPAVAKAEAPDRVAAVVKKTEGEGVEVTDEMNLRAEFMIGAKEGLFLQPAAAAGVASLFPGARKSALGRDETIVCIGTGTGKNAPEVVGEALGRTGAHPRAGGRLPRSPEPLARRND